MAYFFPYLVDPSLIDEIKGLPTEELLDFWEETQFLDEHLKSTDGTVSFLNIEYEKAVIYELQIRKWTGRLDNDTQK